MKSETNDLLRNVLCFAIAVLLSLTELQFVENAEVFSLEFLIVLLLTIPTVYLYILPKQDTVLIFLYNIILVFILDLLGKDVNIVLFLVSLFCVCFLLCQSIFTENARRFKTENTPFVIYVLILVVVLTVVSVGTYIIYEYILKPNMNDKLELSLMYEQTEEQNIEKPNEGMSGEGGGGQKSEINFLKLLILILSAIACLIILYLLYRVMKYVLWLVKTKKSTNNEMIRRIYVYIIDSLILYGISKDLGETPYEYLSSCHRDDLPISETEFEFLTEVFVSTYYGKKEASKEECKRCIELLRSVSRCFKNSLGTRKYLFEYLFKKQLTITM